ncbi:MAG: hypothetical protein ACYDBX_03205 [Patescibacteria group bacterium]
MNISSIYIANLFGILGGLLGIGMALSQAYKIVISRDISGVSINTWILMAVTTFTWLMYGFLFHDFTQIFGNGVVFVIALFIVLLMVYKNPRLNKYILVIFIYTLLLFITTFFIGIGSGIILFSYITSIILPIPQTLKAITKSVMGVSILAWVLKILGSILWMLHGLLLNQPAVTITSGVNILLAITIVVVTSIKAKNLDKAMV